MAGYQTASQHGAFIAEIVASPDDYTPRLIYADFLDERGDPRGEFIRLGCELTRHDAFSVIDSRLRETIERYDELYDELADVCAAPFQEHQCSVRLRGGFVEWLYIDIDDFIGHAADLFNRAPLRTVRFPCYPNCHLQQVQEIPEFRRLSALEIEGRGQPERLSRKFFATDAVEGLGALRFIFCPAEDWLEPLRSSRHLPWLRHLQLHHSLHCRDATRLVSAPFFRSLESLDFWGTNFSGASLRELFTQLRHAPGMSRLSLCHAGLDYTSVTNILAFDTLAQLEALDLRYNAFSLPGKRSLIAGIIERQPDLRLRIDLNIEERDALREEFGPDLDRIVVEPFAPWETYLDEGL